VDEHRCPRPERGLGEPAVARDQAHPAGTPQARLAPGTRIDRPGTQLTVTSEQQQKDMR
jgi:hypothetical protein